MSEKNGLIEINYITKRSYDITKTNSQIIIELSYNQIKKIKKITKLLGFVNTYGSKDTSNLDRIISGEK